LAGQAENAGFTLVVVTTAKLLYESSFQINNLSKPVS